MSAYDNINTKEILDDKLHVLYPINIDAEGGEASNTDHNSTQTEVDAACGAIWIDTTNPKVAGFIRKANTNQYKTPKFLQCASRLTENADHTRVEDYISIGMEYTEDKYSSPHFISSTSHVSSPFITKIHAGTDDIYSIDANAVLYDPLFSSYYFRPNPENNMIDVFHRRSDFNVRYDRNNPQRVTKLDLRENVDAMLNNIVDIGALNPIQVDDNSIYGSDYNTPDVYIKAARFYPSYRKVGDGNFVNMRENGADVPSMEESVYGEEVFINTPHDFVADIGTLPKFEEMLNYKAFSLLSIGEVYPTHERQHQMFTSICDDTISLLFKSSDEVRIYSKDTKWISTPFNDNNRRFICDTSELPDTLKDKIISKSIVSATLRDPYTISETKLAPHTIDHFMRLKNRETAYDENESLKGKHVSLIISKHPISYTYVDGKVMLYNSHNLINSISWEVNDRGFIMMKFENTDALIKNQSIPLRWDV